MAERFDAHVEELGPLVTKENGKKLAEGMSEATLPSDTLRHTAGQALTDTGICAEVAPGQWFSTYAEPAGVAEPVDAVGLKPTAFGRGGSTPSPGIAFPYTAALRAATATVGRAPEARP